MENLTGFPLFKGLSFSCKLLTHPFEDLPLPPGDLHLCGMQDRCRFALGFSRKKTKPDEEPVLGRKSGHYLVQSDPFRQCFLRGIHGDVPLRDTTGMAA